MVLLDSSFAIWIRGKLFKSFLGILFLTLRAGSFVELFVIFVDAATCCCFFSLFGSLRFWIGGLTASYLQMYQYLQGSLYSGVVVVCARDIGTFVCHCD